MGTHVEDEAQILRLDSEWNEAYRRRDRSPLAHILADDFTGLTVTGGPFTKALLMINPSGHGVKSITFSEQFVRVFGGTGISRGRLQIELDDSIVKVAKAAIIDADGKTVTPAPGIDQRFVRVWAKRDGIWQAVSVAVTPVAA
jgi:ketosteroid isomerase-like protein